MLAENESSPTIGAQRGLLALFIKTPDLMLTCDARPEHFDAEELRAIYEAMIRLHDDGVEITAAEIYNSQEPRIQKILQRLSSGDGTDWIRSALLHAPSPKSYDRYVNAILTDAKRRELIMRTETALARAKAEGATQAPDKLAESILAEVEDAYRIVVAGPSKTSACISDRTKEGRHAHYAARKALLDVRGLLSFGSAQFDQFVRGLPAGRFALMIAEKKAGKSMFLLNLGMTMAVGAFLDEDNEWITLNANPEPVLVLDCEMDYEMDFEPRALSWVSGVPSDMIRDGEYLDHPHMIKRIDRAHDLLSKGRLYYDKVPPGDFRAARQSVRYHQAKYGVNRVLYDYIKRPATTENMYIEMGNFARMLNEHVAKALGVSLIAAAQARDDGRVAGSIDLMRECDIAMKLTKVSPVQRKLAVTDSRFTREMGDDEWFNVTCDLTVSRMHIGEISG